MTEADWKKVDEKLKCVGISSVKLKIDGYEVGLHLVQISRFKNAIAVYVNGLFRGKWLMEECEERRRFFPCKKRYAVTDTELKKLGIRSKKELQRWKEESAYYAYSSMWTDFRAMKKHFIENNENIELLEA